MRFLSFVSMRGREWGHSAVRRGWVGRRISPMVGSRTDPRTSNVLHCREHHTRRMPRVFSSSQETRCTTGGGSDLDQCQDRVSLYTYSSTRPKSKSTSETGPSGSNASSGSIATPVSTQTHPRPHRTVPRGRARRRERWTGSLRLPGLSKSSEDNKN